jgi:hypothetical protein
MILFILFVLFILWVLWYINLGMKMMTMILVMMMNLRFLIMWMKKANANIAKEIFNNKNSIKVLCFWMKTEKDM